MRTGSKLRRHARAAAAIAAALACGLLAGCGSSHAAAGSAGPIVPITEHDFHIEAPGRLTAGTYTFRVHNEGATDHELIIAPTTNGTLPLRPDGLTVDEEAVQSAEPGSLEPGSPGAERTLTVQLKPGRYIFFCNMEGHYMAGMHAEVVVG
jgi:plastocyanin